LGAPDERIEIADLRRIYRIQRWEFWLSIGCCIGVVVLGAIPGIGLAILLAVIEFLWGGWRPDSAVLGRVSRRMSSENELRLSWPRRLQRPPSLCLQPT
jgi:MFS superfamily sulfate permease-like transporter